MSNTPDKRTRDILKEYFETGDRPKEIEFIRLIDSGINQKDDELYAVNGNIGVGTSNPQSKLHVEGDIAVTNHIHGDKTNKANDSDVLIVENGSQVQLHGPRHTGKSGGIVIGAKKDNSNPTSGKILFSQVSQTGWQDNVVIDHQGNVGIGAINPQSKLHVSGQTFVSKPGGANVPRTGNMLEVNAHNQNAVAIVTKSNDVLNFVDDGATINPNPFTITDNSGRGFRFYKNAGDVATDGEKLRIQPNGHVGIGTIDPKSKLHVHQNGGNTTGLRLSGQDNVSPGDILALDQGGNAKWVAPTSVTNGLWKKIGTTDHIENGNVGNVGIGTDDPQNKLEIKGTGDTGLRLPTGKGDGKILTSDSDGNAVWKPATDITNSLWQAIGTTGHIRNGNVGNVGVGTSNPESAFHVIGKSEDEDKHGILKINAGTVGKDLRFGVMDGNSGYTWIQSHGAIPLKINPHPAGNTTTINEGGGNVGIGILNPTEKLELTGNINVNGELKLNRQLPILIRRFKSNVEMKSHAVTITWPSGTFGPPNIITSVAGFNTQVPTSFYKAAIITGYATGKTTSKFKTSWYDANGPIAGSHDHEVEVENQQYMFVFKKGGTWHVAADLLSKTIEETWRLDIMFFQHGIVELNPADNWDAPLNT